MEHFDHVRKGAWTEEEDMLLRKCIEKYGEGKWRQVPMRAGLKRCRKSCRLRWLNYLEPNIKRGDFGEDEVDLIFRLHKLLGNRWSLIAGRLPGRTANEIKNYWNCHLKKRLSMQTKTVLLESQIKSKKTTPTKITTTTTSEIIKPQPRTFSPNSKWLNGMGSSIVESQLLQQQMIMSNINAISEFRQEESMLWWESVLTQEKNDNDTNNNSLWDYLSSGGVDQPEEDLPVRFGVEKMEGMMRKEEDHELMVINGGVGDQWDDDMILDIDRWGLLETYNINSNSHDNYHLTLNLGPTL